MTEQERWARVGQALEERALARVIVLDGGITSQGNRVYRVGAIVDDPEVVRPTLLAALEAALGLTGEPMESAS